MNDREGDAGGWKSCLVNRGNTPLALRIRFPRLPPALQSARSLTQRLITEFLSTLHM